MTLLIIAMDKSETQLFIIPSRNKVHVTHLYTTYLFIEYETYISEK